LRDQPAQCGSAVAVQCGSAVAVHQVGRLMIYFLSMKKLHIKKIMHFLQKCNSRFPEFARIFATFLKFLKSSEKYTNFK
jgi:hypothetical protein